MPSGIPGEVRDDGKEAAFEDTVAKNIPELTSGTNPQTQAQ